MPSTARTQHLHLKHSPTMKSVEVSAKLQYSYKRLSFSTLKLEVVLVRHLMEVSSLNVVIIMQI